MSPHVIIFADRAPDGRHRFGSKINSIRYTYSAGAFKIASVLRQSGFSVLVVYSCLNLSFSAITKIINDNSKNLLWVGISTSLLHIEKNGVVRKIILLTLLCYFKLCSILNE
jgi:hypothetical protein